MHRLLDDYLSQVASELRAVPPQQREEELREIRQHLLNAITVSQEMGQDEERAVASAITDFGPPQELATEILVAWRRGDTKDNRRSLIGAILCTLACRSLGAWLFVPFLHSIDAARYLAFERGCIVLSSSMCMLLWYSISAALIGLVAGMLFPRRAIAGIWIATAAMYVLALIQLFSLPLQYPIKQQIIFASGFAGSAITSIFWAWLAIRWRPNRRRHQVAG